MSVTPVAVAEPIANRERIGQYQKSIYQGIIRVLERNADKSLYLNDLKEIQNYTFSDVREIGVLLFLYHNMIVGKDRPAEVKECMTPAKLAHLFAPLVLEKMTEHEWEQFELNRDILIATFFTLLREDEEEERKKKWWYHLLQFFGIKKRTMILPESHFI